MNKPQPSRPEAIFAAVKAAVDDAAVSTIAELDTLIREIEAVKQAVLEHAADMKHQLTRHFDFAAEASGWRESIRNRLLSIAEGTLPPPPPGNGPDRPF